MFEPRFSITNKMLVDISRIEAVEEVIKHSPILPLWEKKFKEEAIVRAVFHGTHLEGNQLEMDEARDVLMGKEIAARPRDIQEIINYRKVIEYIDDEAQRQISKITEQAIKRMHKIIIQSILPEDEQGNYRRKQVVIRNSETGEITFRPPIAIEIPYLMREFVYWLNKTDKDTIHPIIKAGLAHHELVRIHPFLDGNGRLARSMSTLIMLLGGYDIRRFFSLEEYYDKDAYSYYENLQKASDGNMNAWLEYFIHGASIEFDRVKEKILRLSKDAKLKERFGGKQVFLTDRQMKVIEYVQEVGYVQNRMFASIFPSVSEDTVLRDIQELVRQGLLKKVGSTKSARYMLV